LSFNSAPFPVSDAIVKEGSWRPTKPFIEWVTALTSDVDASSARIVTKTVTGQAASIASTPFAVGALSPGLYRVEFYARITQAASTSSSLSVTFSWVDGGIACSKTFTALTGNTTATADGDGLLIRVDQASPVSYSATYASVGGTVMKYRADFVLTQVDA
jgi:hypothetical protein